MKKETFLKLIHLSMNKETSLKLNYFERLDIYSEFDRAFNGDVSEELVCFFLVNSGYLTMTPKKGIFKIPN